MGRKRTGERLRTAGMVMALAVALGACGGGGVDSGPAAPAAPADLAANAPSTTGADLSWTDRSGGESGFEIERSAGPLFNPATTTTVPANTTTFGDTGLLPSSIYYYRVRAYGSGGGSAYSNVAHASTFSVSTIVSSGSGTDAGESGSADAGGGGDGRFNYPGGVATSATGTALYVADTVNHTIRMIDLADANHPVSTLAGAALLPGAADSAGSGARFNHPMGIAVSEDGSFLYVADTLNHAIRRIDRADNSVTTIAGLAGHRGDADGTGAAAAFNQPESVAVTGGSTTLYVADTLNHAIRAIDLSDNSVTTIAGSALLSGSTDSVGGAARFNQPAAVALSPVAPTLYVADRLNHAIRAIDLSDNSVATIAGSALLSGSTDGTGGAARFNQPSGIAVSNDGLFLFVADTGNHTIRRIDLADNSVTTLAGTPGVIGPNSPGSTLFNHPSGLAVRGASLYAADGYNHAIRVVDTGTAAVSAVAGHVSPGTGPVLSNPKGLATTPSGTMLYVADYGQYAVFQVEISSGTVTTLAGMPGQSGTADGTGASARFKRPSGIVTDGTSVFVADTADNTIRQIEISTATVSTLAGQPGLTCQPGTCAADGTGAGARFYGPAGLATSATGSYSNYVFVADAQNHTIRQVEKSTGIVTTIAGQPGLPIACNSLVCYADGVGTAARFNQPSGIAIDGNRLYVADMINQVIRMIDLADSARVTTIAGKAGATGSADGIGSAARFNYPQRVAVKGAGLYITDGLNHTVRRIDLNTLMVTTVAGLAGVPGNTDGGTGTNARFYQPWGIATDGISLFVGNTGGAPAVRVIH